VEYVSVIVIIIVISCISTPILVESGGHAPQEKFEFYNF
jgi:hypothetical protein